MLVELKATQLEKWRAEWESKVKDGVLCKVRGIRLSIG